MLQINIALTGVIILKQMRYENACCTSELAVFCATNKNGIQNVLTTTNAVFSSNSRPFCPPGINDDI